MPPTWLLEVNRQQLGSQLLGKYIMMILDFLAIPGVSTSQVIKLSIIFYSAGSSGHCDISESSSNNSDISERLSERIANSSAAVHSTAATTSGVMAASTNSKASSYLTTTLTTGSTPAASVSLTSKTASGSTSGEKSNDASSSITSSSSPTATTNSKQVSYSYSFPVQSNNHFKISHWSMQGGRIIFFHTNRDIPWAI